MQKHASGWATIEAAAAGVDIEGSAVFPVGGRFVRGNPIGRGNAGRGLWGTLAQPWGGGNSAFRKLAPDRLASAPFSTHTGHIGISFRSTKGFAVI